MTGSSARSQASKPPKLKLTTFQPPSDKHGSPLNSPIQSFLTNSTALDHPSPTRSNVPSPSNNTFLDDARSEVSHMSSPLSRRGSITGQTPQGDGSGMVFISKLHSHYGMFVKMLPILIIFLPSLLKLFFPGVIKFGEFQLGDDKNHPSAIVVDVFSILLICWILKFLLDWPWKWYLQINDLELKLKMYLEGHVEKTTTTHNDSKIQRADTPMFTTRGKVQDITEKGLARLQTQHVVALLLCVMAPFLCGGILLFARNYIILIGTTGDNDHAIFTDLNIGIFVSCGLIRVIIQISEQIQRSTAAIETSTEKMIHTESLESMENELSNRLESLQHYETTPSGLPQEVASLQEQVSKLQGDFKHLSVRFEPFYSKNKFIIEGDMSFLSHRHFKMLEKEINELNHKLQDKTIDLEQMIMQVIRSQSSSSASANNSDELSKDTRRPNSLHGMPLGKNTPNFGNIDSNTGAPMKYPVEGYATVNSGSSGTVFEKMNDYLPNMFESRGGKALNLDEDALRQLEALHEQGYLKVDLGVLLPVVKFLFSVPYLAQRMFWRVVAYIPSQVLRAMYFLLLQALDGLVEIYHKNQREMQMAEAGLDKIQEVRELEETAHGHEETLIHSPKKRRHLNH